MGVLSHLIIAGIEEGQDVLASDDPLLKWEGFSFQGLD